MVVIPEPYSRMQVARRLRALGAREGAEAASLLQARAWARTSGPRDLCIVDIALPDGNGLALLAELRRNGWRGGIGISPVSDLRAVGAAMNAGVNGFILAPQQPLQPGGFRQPRQRHRNRRGTVGGLSAREIQA